MSAIESFREAICAEWTQYFAPLLLELSQQYPSEFNQVSRQDFITASDAVIIKLRMEITPLRERYRDKQARINVDYFMCQVVMGSLKLARTNVISFYSQLKAQYNYDIIAQLDDCQSEDEMIDRLRNINVLLKYALDSMRVILSTQSLFDCAEGVLKQSNNNELRGLYVNALLRLSSNDISNKHALLEKLYGVNQSSSEYFSRLVDDSSVVQAFFEGIKRESRKAKKSLLNNNAEGDDDELDASDIEQMSESKKKLKRTPEQSTASTNNNSVGVSSNSAADAFMLSTPAQDIVRSALLEHTMVVVDGAAGSGKTTLVHWLSKEMAQPMISLFVDATADLKSLVGSYVCTQNVGQFEWKNGPLITCMQEGMWLVLENFAEASEEVIDAIVQCAQQGSYYISTQAKTVTAHYRFKIIGIGNLSGKYESKKQLLMKRCKGGYVNIEDMAESTLRTIIENRYISSNNINNSSSSNSDNSERLFAAVKYLRFDRVISRQYREFRELISSSKILRLFKRLAFHVNIVSAHGASKEAVKEIRRRMFLDFMDIAVLALKEAEADSKLIQEIMRCFDISKEEFTGLVVKYHPDIEVTPKAVRIGRLGVIQRTFFGATPLLPTAAGAALEDASQSSGVVYNGYSSRLIERIANCLYFDEPCLLVGDTGCGKTTMAQHVAAQFRKKLYIYNMNQGSDAIDLIGGFKPIDVRIIVRKLLTKYIKRFSDVASADANKPFFDSLLRLEENRSYPLLLKSMLTSFDAILKKVKKKAQTLANTNEALELTRKWDKMHTKVKQLYANRDKIESNLAFHFVEGNLIKAIKQGDWVLIDEINLASNEVLQKLLPIIEGRSILLYERGDLKEITRHPMFRVLGCMNPGSDVGKKELPANVRGKFTEIYVHDITDREDISNLVRKKLGSLVSSEVSSQIVDLFLTIKRSTESNELCDGYNRKPHVSLRNLARALNYIRSSIGSYSVERAVYDGLYLGFGTALSAQSQEAFEKSLEKLLGISPARYYSHMLNQIPLKVNSATSIVIYGFTVSRGSQPVKRPEECEFFVTDTFKKYIIDLLRAIANTDLPVLLEGPTSAGKTSMVKYIAELAGYKCVRVNNHHHTEIEEYIGTYLPDSKGRLVFHEGVLIEAMKRGDWLILDELNLARSEILESLNRLLDDNKELFVNETQTYIKPHPNFRIFATQNPTTYGGRKELSKAFKNRFVQIYFDEIGEKDLEAILLKRCLKLSASHCKKLIAVLKDLKVFRQRNNFFLGKEGVITVRDLIKWGNRPIDRVEDLAMEGYCLLAERLRTAEERAFILKVIEKHCKVKVEVAEYYEKYSKEVLVPMMQAKKQEVPFYLQLNHGFKRMACLVLKALENVEPVLLIGETGCGKTTLAELVAYLRETKLFSINCHQYTESSDFLGSLRPVRNKEKSQEKLFAFLDAIQVKEVQDKKELLDQMIAVHERVARLAKKMHLSADVSIELEKILVEYETMFEWQDGPLVESMESGGVFLIDEISLAEDSVLERLNSVLESDRFLLLPEKSKSEQVFAHPKFIIIGTMNPGGDFGKRELSPALRNRFTEIWVEPLTTKSLLQTAEGESDVIEMIDTFLTAKRVYQSKETRAAIAQCLYDFLVFYNVTFCEKHNLDKKNITMRDIVALMAFISSCRGNCSVRDLYAHALALVIVEPIGFLGNSAAEKTQMRLEIECFIQDQLETMVIDEHEDEKNIDRVRKMSALIEIESLQQDLIEPTSWHVGSFSIPIQQHATATALASTSQIKYSTGCARTQSSLEKIIRAMQLDKAILLEGLPGVGKSSMVEYIALKTKNELARISLSEQTDIVDLLGSDLPAPSSEETNNSQSSNSGGMKFKWFDGVLLDALKKGSWILLEELNLASQSVLEGLNAILDHRGTVFIPEINQSFTKHPNFRVFATQNPMSLGGGRKGLPASFLNRFSKIFIEEYTADEFEYILRDLFYERFSSAATTTHSSSSNDIFEGMLRVANDSQQQHHNSSSKLNLRDFLRFSEIALSSSVGIAFEIIFSQKLAPKTVEDYFTINNNDKSALDCDSHLSSTLKQRIPLTYGYFDHQNEQILLLNSQRKPLTYLQMLIERCSHHCTAFVVRGRPGSGKSNLVRILGELNTGKRIVTFTLNSTTDSSELIGGYDQVDSSRRIAQSISRITLTATEVLQQSDDQAVLIGLSQTIQLMKTLETSKKFAADEMNTATAHTTKATTIKFIEETIVFFESIANSLLLTTAAAELRSALKEINSHVVHTSDASASSTSSFEWFDSVIIDAVQRGDWLVLDGVRRANQAVFARLNSLMERDLQGRRRIVITECHSRDSQSQSISSHDYIQIHEDFRLFLLVDTEDGSTDCSLNDSIRNRCVEIQIDAFEAKTVAADLKALAQISLVAANSQAITDTITQRIIQWIDALPPHQKYFDVGLYMRFLQIFTARLNTVQYTFTSSNDANKLIERIVVEVMYATYMVSSSTYTRQQAMASIDEAHNSDDKSRKQYSSELAISSEWTEKYRSIYHEQITSLENACEWWNALNWTEFPMNRELHRYRGVAAAVLAEQSLTTTWKLAENFSRVLSAERFPSHVIQQIARLTLVQLHAIQTKSVSTRILLNQFIDALDQIRQRRKVFAGSIEFRRAKENVLNVFNEAVESICRRSDDSVAIDIVQQALLQAIAKIEQLPKIHKLIAEKVRNAIAATVRNTKGLTNAIAQTAQTSLNDNLFVVLWRACAFFQRMPRNVYAFEQRQKVAYLLSIHSKLSQSFGESNNNDQESLEKATAIIELKKRFNLMYFLENAKTRLTGIEVLALIYSGTSFKGNNDNSDDSAEIIALQRETSKRLFEAFEMEIMSILNNNHTEYFSSNTANLPVAAAAAAASTVTTDTTNKKNEDETAQQTIIEVKKHEICIIDSQFSAEEVLYRIPIIASEQSLRYYEISTMLEEQLLNGHGQFSSASFVAMREFCVFEAVKAFAVNSSRQMNYSHDSTVNSLVEDLKLSVVEHIDKPDFYAMRVFALLRDGRTNSIDDLVEIFYLARMKSRHVDRLLMRECAREIKSVKIKHLPLLNREVHQLRSAINMGMHVSSDAAAVDDDAIDHEESTRLFVLAYLWLIRVFERIVSGSESQESKNTTPANAHVHQFQQILTQINKKEVDEIISFQESILLRKPKANKNNQVLHGFLEELCIAINAELKDIILSGEFLRIGGLFLRLFSIRSTYFAQETSSGQHSTSTLSSQQQSHHRDCLSELVKEDYELQFAETAFEDRWNDYVSLCVIEQALAGNVDATNSRHTRESETLTALSKQLKVMKSRIIYRGGNDNINAFSEFFAENLPFIEKIEGYFDRISSSQAHVEEQTIREMKEAVKHIDNWLHLSFEKYYEAFADFLIPLHFALILFKEYLQDSCRKAVTTIRQQVEDNIDATTNADEYEQSMTSSSIRLICGSGSERLQQFASMILNQQNGYALMHCDAILKHIRMSQVLNQDSKQLRALCDKILEIVHSNLTLSETYDKLVEDDTTKYIKAQRQFEAMIIDEYKKETIDAYKAKEREEIHATFSSFGKDYHHFLQLDLSVSEKLDASKEKLNEIYERLARVDEDATESSQTKKPFEELSNKELEVVKARSIAVVLEMLDIAEQQRCMKKQQQYNNNSETATIIDKEKKKEQDFHGVGAWKDFSFAHRLIYLKLWMRSHSSDSNDGSRNDDDIAMEQRINDMLEYSSAFGQIIKENLFDSCLPALAAATTTKQKKKRRVVIQQLDTSQTQFNVYEDIIPSENVKVMQPLMALLSSIRRLLYEEEVFAGNENLMCLAMLCDFVLELPVLTTPLNQIITGIQVVAEKVEEWNTATARMYSFIEEIKPIVELLLYWRKLERKCWKFMLAKKDKEIESLDVVMFLRMRSLLFEQIGGVNQKHEQWKIIETYMRGSVMGTFGLRLKALYYLGHCDGTIAEASQLQSSLQSSYVYYSTFFAAYSTAILTNRNEHEKECADYVTLAGWDSKHYLTLKQTIEKFQTKVYRIIKRYRDFLQEPVEKHVFEIHRNSVFVESFQAFHERFFGTYVSETSKLVPAAASLSLNQDSPAAVGVQCAKILSSSMLSISTIDVAQLKAQQQQQQLDSITSKVSGAHDDTSVWLYKEEMIAHVFERIFDLQNTQEVTRSMKFKAVLDFFKYLTYLGFKSYTPLVPSTALIYEGLFASTNTINTTAHLDSQLQQSLSNDFTYISNSQTNVLDMLLTLRSNGAYHDDISRENIRRGCALLMQYFAFIEKLRASMTRIFASSADVLSTMHSIADVEGIAHVIRVTPKVKDTECQIKQFIVSTQNMREELLEIGETDPEGIQAISENISELVADAFTRRRAVVDARKVSNILEAVMSMQTCLHKYAAKTQQYRDVQIIVKGRIRLAAKSVEGIIAMVEDILINETVDAQQQQIVSEEDESSDNGEGAIVKDIQIFAQTLVKCIAEYKSNLKAVIEDEDDQDEGEEGAVAESTNEQGINQEVNSSAAAAIQKKKIEVSFIVNEETVLEKFAKQLDRFWKKFSANHLERVASNVKSFGRVRALFSVISMYLTNCIVYFTKSLRSQSKFVQLLGTVLQNLVYKGFCQPKSEDEANGEDGDRDSGKIDYKEGTGIGEGIGMENVSKEIEFEEQLLGNKGDDEQEDADGQQEEEKKEEKDDFFKMEQDFNGTTSKQDEMDDNQKDQADKDADEIFSQVSEEELDFKMWEGDDNEDTKDNEKTEPNRKKDDIQFNGNDKASGEENDRAKEQEKEKKDTRNIDKFEATEQQEQPESEQPLINELKNPVGDEEEDEKDDNKKRRKKDGDEEEEDDEEEGEANKDAATAEVMETEQVNEQMVPEEIDNAMDIEGGVEEEGEEQTQQQDQAMNEEQEKKPEDDNQDAAAAAVPEAEQNQTNQEKKDVDEEKKKEEEKSKKENKKKKQPKKDEKNAGKKFGVEGDDDFIEIEDAGDDDALKEKQLEQQQVQQKSSGDSKDDQIQQVDSLEQQKQNKQNNTKQVVDEEDENRFSLDFLREMIEKTQTNAKDLKNFFRDLNVVVDEKMTIQEMTSVPKFQQEMIDGHDVEGMEFEVVNTKQLDAEELKNMIATNMNAPEMHSASAAAQQDTQMDNEEDADNAQMQQQQQQQQQKNTAPKQPSLPNQPEHEQKKKEELKQKQKNDQLNNHGKKNNEEIDFLEEKRRAEEKARLAEERKKRIRQSKRENGEMVEESDESDEEAKNKNDVSTFDRNAHLKKDRRQMMEVEDASESDDDDDDDDEATKDKLATAVTVAEKRAAMLQLIQQSKANGENAQSSKGYGLWNRIESEVKQLSHSLCEELKTIFEPTVIASFKGDYKSGKRLNMKKIIPYIASNFRKDKIWLRRSDPSKRTYQILLAIDDSLSMSQQNVGYFALQSMMVLALAMTKLEVGQIGIAAVKNGLTLIHDFNAPLTPADSPFILSQFDFTHAQANSSDLDLVRFMRQTIDLMKEAKKSGTKDTQQICFIMSDGRFNKKLVKPLVVEAEQNQVLFVFIVLDKPEEKESILNVKSTSQKYVNGKLQIEMKLYLEDFPFKNYIVVKDVHELSRVLVDILRQYYEMSSTNN